MNRYSRILALVVLLVLVAAGGCTAGKWNRYELFMGQTSNEGKHRVSAREWQSFLQSEVTPKFQSGYTVYDAEGFWAGKGMTYSERSKVLMVVSPDKDAEERIDSIAAAYKDRFKQDSVLKIVTPAQVDFK
ncbi:DUF3574 domain-containing protein [Maridesulfovibrio sp. FT414]|uniref:DUF3574 domain-containing protein n=1 Tax=Maridesulfovibrio sp. FT414 TaxID=2979469 RepID=UPI003D801B9F